MRGGTAITSGQRIAVVGSGAAGLAAAWALSHRHDVHLYEADSRLGGHANTVTVEGPKGPVAVDTGFIVYNEPNYPNLVQLLDQLGVESAASDMSFAVSLDRGRYEYAGSPLGLFAQPSNALVPSHWRLIADALRFFKQGQALLAAGTASGTLGAFLDAGGYSKAFREKHLLPMAAAIWSSAPGAIEAFPLASFLRFFDNHGLLQTANRPLWRTLAGGSRSYVDAIAASLGPERLRLGQAVVQVEELDAGLKLTDSSGQSDSFDQVVLACHGDTALSILGDAATEPEHQILGAFHYSRNEALLHSDPSLMPRRRRVWSSWNYLAESDRLAPNDGLCVSYWMNRLQPLDPSFPLFVTLNAPREPDPALLHGRYTYDHPLFDQAALAAQQRLPEIQGQRRLWFCGSYCGYGFHEDALQAGFAVAASLGAPAPWADAVTPRSPAAAAARPGLGPTGDAVLVGA
ncbi:MAG: FAD-dependent oxidoreductase [Pseudomonadota bacterium]